MAQDDHARIERLYARLTDALQRSRREPFDVPVTVAEIYQELVPYRLVRSEVGFDMNADYEHALLLLLSGEGEHVRVEPSQVADEIRRELRDANPNLSIYRDYAACDVWVRRPAVMPSASTVSFAPAAPQAADLPQVEARVGLHGGPAPPDLPAPATTPEAVATDATLEIFTLDEYEPTESENQAMPVAQAAEVSGPVGDAPAGIERTVAGAAARAGDTSSQVAAPGAGDTTSPMPAPRVEEQARAHRPAPEPGLATPGKDAVAPRCAFCDSALPGQRPARFCPFCGADQSTRPCSSCGEVVEPGWVFCISCGTAAR